MKGNKIIVLGSLAFDYIMSFEENFVNAVSIDHEKEEYQSTVTANSRVQRFGGTAGNISYNLGLLNTSPVLLLGSVGIDFNTLGYRDHLTKFPNIDLNVDIQPNLFTAACYIVNDKKSNQMIIFHGGALDENKNIDLQQKIKEPEQYAYAINSTQSVDAMKSLADQLSDLKIPMIFDPGQVTPLFSKDDLVDILKKSDILIGNSFEINQVSKKTDLDEQNILKLVKLIIKTKGSEGSELFYKTDTEELKRIEIPIAIPNTMVDATGAGDAYRAGILTGLILNMNPLESCKLGSILGSFVVETSGAQTQIYDIVKVIKRFQKTYGYIPPELEKL
jgi:adenosine kinase